MLKIIEPILDLLFPRNCVGCGERDALLCPTCLYMLPLAENDCPNIRSRYSYGGDVVRKSIHKLKYKNLRGFADILGQSLGEYILEELSDFELLTNFTNPIIVPAPLSSKRVRERGYNQAELIARAVARVTNLPLDTKLVIKIKDTPSQVSKQKRAERLENPKGAFAVHNPSLVRKRNIIVIDDVYTTGATAREIMRVLRRAGARQVLTYTVAH